MSDLIYRQDAIDALDKRFDSIPMEQTAEILLLRKDLRELPSAQPEPKTSESGSVDSEMPEIKTDRTMSGDLINRQAAINAIENTECELLPEEWDELTDAIKAVPPAPSAQPERLTDDDFETIRIHLNAQKEKLCNQRRWKEADEYQRIVDRFMAFASAQSKIIRCKDCKHRDSNDCPMYYEEWIEIDEGDGYFDTDNIIHDWTTDEGFCHCAERRTDD